MNDTPREREHQLLSGVLPSLAIALACWAVPQLLERVGVHFSKWSVMLVATVGLVAISTLLVWLARAPPAGWRTRPRLYTMGALGMIALGMLAVGYYEPEPEVLLEARFTYLDAHGRIRLLPENTPPEVAADLQLSAADLKRQAVDVPIGLALANKGTRSFDQATVEIGYPSYLEVRSHGMPALAGDNSTITYENKVPVLHTGDADAFRPTPLDTLTIEFRLLHFTTAALTRDGVPLVIRSTIAAFAPPDDAHIRPSLERAIMLPLVVKIFDGHRLLGGFLAPMATFPKVSKVEIVGAPRGSRRSTRSQRSLVGVVLRKGAVGKRLKGKQMDYTETSYRGDRFQIISVGSRPRWVMIDRNGDGRLDEQLVDTDEDGVLDLHGRTPSHPTVRRWKQRWIGQPDQAAGP